MEYSVNYLNGLKTYKSSHNNNVQKFTFIIIKLSY